MQTEEMLFCKNLFNTLGRKESMELLNNSNLTDRERDIILMRLIYGKSLKECSDVLIIEQDSVNKAQKKAVIKLYQWINNKGKIIELIRLLN